MFQIRLRSTYVLLVFVLTLLIAFLAANDVRADSEWPTMERHHFYGTTFNGEGNPVSGTVLWQCTIDGVPTAYPSAYIHGTGSDGSYDFYWYQPDFWTACYSIATTDSIRAYSNITIVDVDASLEHEVNFTITGHKRRLNSLLLSDES